MINGLIAAAALWGAAHLPPLHVEGKNLVDPAGRPVLLKGCNVGNWLVNEFWMLGVDGRSGTPPDQYGLEQTLTQRFGKAEDLRLMNLLRSSWMTERDWQNIQSFHFNFVRVPFNYRLLMDDDHPYVLRDDAWQWLDKAVDESERHGMYVDLDMHGVPGGQSVYDHTGRSGQNKVWTSDEDQARMCWLWAQIAKRYRDRTAVVAYDPMNEPYGGTKSQVLALFKKVYPAIRAVDPDKMIIAQGAPDNFDHFGDPKAQGWRRVGIEMHYYPGLFGDPPILRSTVRHLNRVPDIAKRIDALDVPFYIGEMNVVLDASGGAAMMRRFWDAYESHGWMVTLWSYKVITAHGGTNGGSWGMVTNSEPAPQINYDTASETEIEAYFASFATQPLMVYEALREDLTAEHPNLPPLPVGSTPRRTAPADEPIPGMTAADIGGAIPGGLVNRGTEFDLYGGGDDVWGSSDSFRFLSATESGPIDARVTLAAMEDTAGYTKAGLMLRGSLGPDAPCVLVTVFADGGTQIAVRDEKGGEMKGIDGPKNVLPNAHLRIVRSGSKITAYVNDREVRTVDVPALAGKVYVGPIALSHSGGELTKATYRDLHITRE